MRCAAFWIVLGCLLAPGLAWARDFYVEPDRGVDSADGSSGPLRTIARAVALAGAGDTVHLAARAEPYRESVALRSRAGDTGRPLIVDGHGATLSGAEPLRAAEWVAAGPGLFRNNTLYATFADGDFAIQRMYFIFNGQMQRMGRTSKGPKQPFKAPQSLAAGEWTFVPGTSVFYVRIAPGQALADAHVEFPSRLNGVGIHGKGNAHLVIRNLTVTHFLNDGFSIHHEAKNVRFENIGACENGDDGFSAHETCETDIKAKTAWRTARSPETRGP
jgi:hypothetical protein